MEDIARTLEPRETPPIADFDQYVSYEDDGATVICDRASATAWIRSDTVRSCER